MVIGNALHTHVTIKKFSAMRHVFIGIIAMMFLYFLPYLRCDTA